jgi:hypothetical protein
MPSTAYREWTTTRARALDEIAQAHAAVGGTRRGRRYATQQVNRAYAVLLASQFQGFCRDLHSECVDHMAAAVTLVAAIKPDPFQLVLQGEFTRSRQLDRSNAQPSSIGADFGRLGIPFWDKVDSYNPENARRQVLLEELNGWRNAIVHQNFDPAKLGGTTVLRLGRVKKWRIACNHLARAFDEVLHRHLQTLTGAAPW